MAFTHNGIGLFFSIYGLQIPPTQAQADEWFNRHNNEILQPAIAAGCKRLQLHCINTFNVNASCYTAWQSGVVTDIELALYGRIITTWKQQVPDGDIVLYSGILRDAGPARRGPITKCRPIKPGAETTEFVLERVRERNRWGVSMCGLDASSVTQITNDWVTTMDVDPLIVGGSMLDVAIPIYQRCLAYGIVCQFQGFILRKSATTGKWMFNTSVYRSVDLNWLSQTQESTWLQRLEAETGPINASAVRDAWTVLDWNAHTANNALIQWRKWRAQGIGLLFSNPAQIAMIPQVLA